jgi:protein-disulfide isomerase
MARSRHALATAALALIVACGPGPEQVSELKAQQKEILSKLGDVDTKLEQIATAPAAQAAAPPAVDPNQVFELPVGASPVKGDPNGKVAIVEFADFQ